MPSLFCTQAVFGHLDVQQQLLPHPPENVSDRIDQLLRLVEKSTFKKNDTVASVEQCGGKKSAFFSVLSLVHRNHENVLVTVVRQEVAERRVGQALHFSLALDVVHVGFIPEEDEERVESGAEQQHV